MSERAEPESSIDLLIRGARVLDTRAGAIRSADLAIAGERIRELLAPGAAPEGDARAARTLDATGRILVPGFINTHLHVESSLVTPQEYDRMVLPRGTTTIVCDPHEMANVLGTRAFDFFLDSAAAMVMDMFVGLSSCVPATQLGTSGAAIPAADLRPYMDRDHVIGLAEMMDIGGMVNDAPGVLEKLELFRGRYVGGHLPLIDDPDLLGKVRRLGLHDDHESVSAAEAEAKLAAGLNVLIREGTAAKNLAALAPIIRAEYDGRLAFCTDDRHPNEVRAEGELDHIVREAIRLYDPDQHGPDREAHEIRVYRMATLWAAENFGLSDRGALEPGMLADLVVLANLKECRAETVVKRGRVVDEAAFDARVPVDPQAYGAYGTVRFRGRDAIRPADLVKPAPPGGGPTPVIGIVPGQIVTRAETAELATDDGGALQPDPARDIAKLAVIERHGRAGTVGVGFVRGFGLDNGAIGSSLAHDDHNLILAGTDDAQIAQAAERLHDLGGGFVLLGDGHVLAEQPLPIAGLMSDRPWDQVADRQERLLLEVRRMGFDVADPTMTLAFLALPVIPDLKLCDRGLTRFGAPDYPVPTALEA